MRRSEGFFWVMGSSLTYAMGTRGGGGGGAAVNVSIRETMHCISISPANDSDETYNRQRDNKQEMSVPIFWEK